MILITPEDIRQEHTMIMMISHESGLADKKRTGENAPGREDGRQGRSQINPDSMSWDRLVSVLN